MAGVWRAITDVGKTLSGVLGVGQGEPPEDEAGLPEEGAGPAQDEAGDALPQTGGDPGADVPAAEEDPRVPDTATLDAPVPGQQPEAQPEVQPEQQPDAVLAAAVDRARDAAAELAGRALGEHLGVEVEAPQADGPVLTHCFATTDPAYVGWRWAVTVARADGSDAVTVDEVVLLPGADALLAPAWVPWSERVRPGDLSAGDLLPPAPDDERLVPAYADPEAATAADEALADATRWELGLGRPRVLSLEGRADAADRWWHGEAGPDAPIARQAPGRCVDCGFLVLLAGSLRTSFGVCANGNAPDDGRVVALAHGCGAHSETVVELQHQATAGMAVEDDEFELVPVAELSAPQPVDAELSGS